MSAKIKPRILRGTRDFLPQTMLLRQHVTGVIRAAFERFGFEPLETPAIELAETLEGKYGPEGDQLVYRFRDRGRRRVGLRYDLTVPLCRVVAMYPALPKPFKRYQMQPVWRADKPRKGRYREFWQCDCDIVGSTSMLADAEIISLVTTVLPALGLREFTVRLNNRKLLTGLAQYAGVPEAEAPDIFRAIDKLDRMGRDGVMQELLTREVGAGSRFAAGATAPEDGDDPATPSRGHEQRELFLSEETATRLLDLVALRGPAHEVLTDLRGTLGEIPLAATGITELTEIVGYLEALEVPAHCYQVDLSLARGLDYYTGPIFETEVGQLVNGRPIGSVTGGGRYDELLGMFTSRGLPATGTTLGIERLIDVLEELGGADAGAARTITSVLVTVFDSDHLKDSLALAAALRRAGINTELPLETRRLGAQLRQANQRGIPWAVFLGPDEVAAGQATLRDMRSGDQTTLPQAEVATFLQARLTDT